MKISNITLCIFKKTTFLVPTKNLINVYINACLMHTVGYGSKEDL